jgi:putative membrane protein
MEHHDFSRPRTPREFLRLFLTGFAMGSADIVPGVSGGTIAFISGIYESLLNAIKSFDLTVIRKVLKFDVKGAVEHVPFPFLIALGLGILTAIFTLSEFLGSALDTTPTYVFAFFGGLVIASIVAIGLKIEWNIAALAWLVIGTVFAFWLVGLEALDPANVDHSLPTLFISGAIAIMAMILPGISGSFILLILGQYPFILAAVRSRDFLVLIVVAAGCAVGIIGFSRVLSWLLKNYENVTVAALTGFMLGSLRKIWMEIDAGTSVMPTFGTTEIVISIVLAILGFLLVSFIDHVSTGTNPFFKLFWKREPVVAVETA